MRISDWSSDVCSSDLTVRTDRKTWQDKGRHGREPRDRFPGLTRSDRTSRRGTENDPAHADAARIKCCKRRQRVADRDQIGARHEERGQGERRHPVKHRMAFIKRHHRTPDRSEEHTSELQSLMRISYAVFCVKKNHSQL